MKKLKILITTAICAILLSSCVATMHDNDGYKHRNHDNNGHHYGQRHHHNSNDVDFNLHIK